MNTTILEPYATAAVTDIGSKPGGFQLLNDICAGLSIDLGKMEPADAIMLSNTTMEFIHDYNNTTGADRNRISIDFQICKIVGVVKAGTKFTPIQLANAVSAMTEKYLHAEANQNRPLQMHIKNTIWQLMDYYEEN